MSLVPALVPINKQYIFTALLSVDECAERLGQVIDRGVKEDHSKPLQGTLENNKFRLTNRGAWWRALFQPQAIGNIEEQSDGKTAVRFITKLKAPAEWLINSALSTLAGAIVGLIASFYLVSDPVAVTYSFLVIAVLPFLTALAAVLFVQSIVPEDSKLIADQIARALGDVRYSVEGASAASTSFPSSMADKQGSVTQQIVSGLLACGIALGAAYYIHQMSWQYWCKGEYFKAEDLCRPVAQLTQAFLGARSGAAADSRFYLAECLRCQGPEVEKPNGISRLREAKEIYEDSLENMKSAVGEKNPFVADVMFSLARVDEQLGHNQEAEEFYLKAIDVWQNSKLVGSRNTFLARALDRLAMLYLKQNRYDEAFAMAFRAISIDQAYGEKSGRALGEDYNDLALIYDKMEEYGKAVEFYEKALAEKTKVVGAEHYSVATTLFNLSEVKRAQGDKKSYKELSSKAYAIWAKTIGGQDAWLTDAMQKYRVILSKTRSDYEVPHSDTRFDGLRPYLGRP